MDIKLQAEVAIAEVKALLAYMWLKGGPGSGNWGHAGRPGKRGGSMSRGQAMSRTTGQDWQARQAAARGGSVSMVDKETGIDLRDPNARGVWLGRRRQELEAGLRSEVAGLLAPYAKEQGWTADQVGMAADAMLLDEDSFGRYGARFGIADAEARAGEVMRRQRDIDRAMAREQYEFEGRNTAQFINDYGETVPRAHTGLSPRLQQTAVAGLVGQDADEAAEVLQRRFGVRFENHSSTDPAVVHKQLSWLLNIADANPAVAGVLKEKTSKIWYNDARPGETKTAEWQPDGIRVAQSDYMNPTTWVHELGHGAEEFMPAQAVTGIFDREKRASRYAWGNASEDFAETFTAMVGGGYDQTWLRQNMPEKYQAIIDNVPGVKESI